jgi:menaquinone-dependent protoporphyrinogen oxidase
MGCGRRTDFDGVVIVMDVLVAYATKHGSTGQVAEEIAGTVRECGVGVELNRARDVRGTVAGHGVVVLGAPLYSGRWHRDAHRFLRRHRKELATVPVAVFAMGPRTDTVDAWHRSYDQLARALRKHRWLRPVAVVVFGGVDPPSHVHPRRDLRDWRDIRRWARRITKPAETELEERHGTEMHVAGHRGPAGGEQSGGGARGRPDGQPPG